MKLKHNNATTQQLYKPFRAGLLASVLLLSSHAQESDVQPTVELDPPHDGASPEWTEVYWGFMDTFYPSPKPEGIVDSDGDLVSDEIELALDLNPTDPTDAGQDADFDRLTLAEELFLGTDDALVDSNGNGISDWDEVFIHRTDPMELVEEVTEPAAILAPAAAAAQPANPVIFTNSFDNYTLNRKSGRLKWGIVNTKNDGWGKIELQGASGGKSYVELAAHNGITSMSKTVTLDKGFYNLEWRHKPRNHTKAGKSPYKVTIAGSSPADTTYSHSWANHKDPWTEAQQFFFVDEDGTKITLSFASTKTSNKTYGAFIDDITLTLLPVEVVDKDKKAITELKVGKMENALTAAGVLDIDKDEDRFFVRIPGGAALKNVSIKLGTVENSDGSYNDDATEIDMVVDGNDLITKSLLLVSDDIDDDYAGNGVGADDSKNDRTHKVQLGGKVQVKSITIDGTEHQLDMKTDVPAKKKVNINVIILKLGGVPVVTQASVQANLKSALEHYAQAGIKIEWNLAQKDQPIGVDLSNGLSEFQTNTPTAEEKALIGGLGTASTDDIHVFYVNRLTPDGSTGEAFPPSYFNKAADKVYTENIIISSTRGFQTLTHEIAHILLNDSSHLNDSKNVLFSTVVYNNSLLAPKRFSKQQSQTMLSSSHAKNP